MFRAIFPDSLKKYIPYSQVKLTEMRNIIIYIILYIKNVQQQSIAINLFATMSRVFDDLPTDCWLVPNLRPLAAKLPVQGTVPGHGHV